MCTIERPRFRVGILKSPPEKHAATTLHVAAHGHPDGLVVGGDGSFSRRRELV